jgi:A/G-specific adenine glycosylase
MEDITPTIIEAFQEVVLGHFMSHRRAMPWREPEVDGTFDPYKILVSELMLQQTQVNRVVPKYAEFLEVFPTINTLARGRLDKVLRVWSGLGYNRRAKYLYDAAKQLVSRAWPWKLQDLIACKGIGPNTAAAILTYAYNQPGVFIETNIRTVFIHHFFHDQTGVSDKAILELVAKTLPHQDYRTWYWALMDYGDFLKATIGNKSRQARAYNKQSSFHGSIRQLRGQVLRLLGEKPMSKAVLSQKMSDDRLENVCKDLMSEGLIHQKDGDYFLG